MSGSTGQYGPFDFALTQLDFITSSGNSIDLRPIFTQLNLFQGVFESVMSGNVTVTDSTNIFGYIVLQGNEFLTVQLDKPGLNKPINKTFRIYGKPSVNIEKLSNQTVKFNFCSEELLISKGVPFSKTYTQMLISDMAKDVATNILKIPTTSFPPTNIETTKTIQTISIPYYNPLQALNWLASKATSAYVGATYCFFENPTGFNFQSLQHLMDSQSVATYNYNVKNIGAKGTPGVSDPNLDFYDVQQQQIVSTPDTLSSLINGHFAGKLSTLDPLRGVYTEGNLNGDDLFNASVTLGSGKPYNNFTDRLGNTLATNYSAYKKYYPTNIGQPTAQYMQSKGVQINPTGVEQWLLERNAMFMQLLGTRMKLTIPGNSLLKCGDIITYNHPSIEPQTGPNTGDVDRKLDPYLQGTWIITAIRHKVDIRTFETVIEICRNALAQSFPGNNGSDAGLPI